MFDEARRALTWHYQWIVARDFLPRVVGAELVDDVLEHGGRWFAPEPGEAFLPLEFADAAYRYGHGQIRHSYRLTVGGDAVPLFPDLVGFAPVPPEHHLDLARIVDLPGRPPAQRAKRLDGTLPTSLIGLPRQVTGEVSVGAYRSLAVRDLLRGEATGLPAGETVAKRGVPAHFLPHIQGLRAIAVLLVVIYHFEPGRLTGGYIGVDVFFVISGFLITQQLSRELERTDRIKLPSFWAKRVRRLLPAALLVLAFATVATLLFVPVVFSIVHGRERRDPTPHTLPARV